MLTDLKQNPNIALEDLFALLSEALNEANEIVLLREPKAIKTLFTSINSFRF